MTINSKWRDNYVAAAQKGKPLFHEQTTCIIDLVNIERAGRDRGPRAANGPQIIT